MVVTAIHLVGACIQLNKETKENSVLSVLYCPFKSFSHGTVDADPLDVVIQDGQSVSEGLLWESREKGGI